MPNKTKKTSRTYRLWLALKWSARWFRLTLAWYVIGATTVACFIAVIVGNWWIVPIYLFVVDVATGRVIAAEAALDRSGYVPNVPGVNALRRKLKSFHEWRHNEKEQGNGEAREAS